MARTREMVEAGSGDVFVDLGFTDASERKLRVQLAMRLITLLDHDVEIVIRPKAARRTHGMLSVV